MTLGGLVVPLLRTRRGLAAGRGATVVAAVTSSLDGGLALVLAAAAGASAAGLVHWSAS